MMLMNFKLSLTNRTLMLRGINDRGRTALSLLLSLLIIVIVTLGALSLRYFTQAEKFDDPEAVALNFVKAACSDGINKLSKYLTQDSQQLVKVSRSNATGVCYVLKQVSSDKGVKVAAELASEEEGRKDYGIKLSKDDVNILASLDLPPYIQQHGLPLVVRQEESLWKVDLRASDQKLAEIGLEHLENQHGDKLPSAPPSWYPAPEGMPAPPGLH